MSPHPLPKKLADLISKGLWPRSTPYHSMVFFDEVVSKIIPEENNICFYPPPFKTIGEQIRHYKIWKNRLFGLNIVHCHWLSDEYKIDQIDIDKTVPIADFGIGTESFLALDYSVGNEPQVIKSFIHKGWSKCFENFDDFCQRLDLENKLKKIAGQ